MLRQMTIASGLLFCLSSNVVAAPLPVANEQHVSEARELSTLVLSDNSAKAAAEEFWNLRVLVFHDPESARGDAEKQHAASLQSAINIVTQKRATLAAVYADHFSDEQLKAFIELLRNPTYQRYEAGKLAIQQKLLTKHLGSSSEERSKLALELLQIVSSSGSGVDQHTQGEIDKFNEERTPYYASEFSETELRDIAAFMTGPKYLDFKRARQAIKSDPRLSPVNAGTSGVDKGASRETFKDNSP